MCAPWGGEGLGVCHSQEGGTGCAPEGRGGVFLGGRGWDVPLSEGKGAAVCALWEGDGVCTQMPLMETGAGHVCSSWSGGAGAMMPFMGGAGVCSSSLGCSVPLRVILRCAPQGGEGLRV